MVQTMKRALRKCLCDARGENKEELMPYIAMGYRMSRQKAMGYSPSFLMFGRDGILQARHQPVMELEADLFDEDMEVFLSQRGQTSKRVMPLAMRNLAIA